jgi:chromosome segregation ATPase
MKLLTERTHKVLRDLEASLHKQEQD